MTSASRPKRAGKRALAALAAGAIAIPVSPFLANAAFAAGEDTPPPPADITQQACPPSQVSQGSFNDIQQLPSTTQLAINCIADYGVTQGKTATQYGPQYQVLRMEMALFFYRMGNYAGVNWDTTGGNFPDIGNLPASFQNAINALANANIVSGYSDGTFKPSRDVTRAEMAKFLDNFYGLVHGSKFPAAGKDYYTDDQTINAALQQAINDITAGTIANGKGNHIYDPSSGVLRSQMALFLSRELEVLIEAGDIQSLYDTGQAQVSVSPTTQTAGNDVVVTVTPERGCAERLVGDGVRCLCADHHGDVRPEQRHGRLPGERSDQPRVRPLAPAR